jgi:hypothetical protein
MSAAPAVDAPPTRRELLELHGGLVLTNVIWSFMHVIMCVMTCARLRTQQPA